MCCVGRKELQTGMQRKRKECWLLCSKCFSLTNKCFRLFVKYKRQQHLRSICFKEVNREAISLHISVSFSISLGKNSPATVYLNLINSLWQLLSLQLHFPQMFMIKKDTVHSFLFLDFFFSPYESLQYVMNDCCQEHTAKCLCDDYVRGS